MWLIAEYQPTALFSLKPAWATSSGGKSLLLPTPFAIKMALLDAACRAEGVQAAEVIWPTIRDLTVALRGPKWLVVTNTFTKILKPRRTPAEPGSGHAGPLQKTIGYREYVQHFGSIAIGLQIEDTDIAEAMVNRLLQINYLGKRGSFMQLMSSPQLVEELPSDFLVIAQTEASEGFLIEGTLHQLDDCGPKVTFDQANIYSAKGIRLGKERILYHVVLPYRLARSSKSYSYYERIGLGERD
jgi:hypothetical protein